MVIVLFQSVPLNFNNLLEHIKCSLNHAFFKAILHIIFLSAILICSFA